MPSALRRPARLAMAVLGAVLTATVLASCSSDPPGPPSPSLGIVQDRAVPSIPLVDAQGRSVTLADFRGKTVLLAPMLTLCQEVCPLTTANLLLVQRAVDQAGLASKVAIVEYSIDPARDTPARLAAYAHLTGASWTMLTGTQAQVDAMDSFFYVFVQKVPEGSPPQLDWWTHQPLTYDLNHTDGFFLIDASGHERFGTGATPAVPGHTIPKALTSMLDDQGLRNLNAPSGQTWTVPQALGALGWLLHRTIPPPS